MQWSFERIFRLLMGVVIAGVIAAFGVTLVTIRESPDADGSGLIGSLMIITSVIFIIWWQKDSLPKLLRDHILAVNNFLRQILKSVSKITCLCSILILACIVSIWIVTGVYRFLMAPIGFKAAHVRGSVEGLADAFWIPVAITLVISATVYGMADESLRKHHSPEDGR